MWFKKKSVLLAEGNYNAEKSVDGSDWRTNGNDGSWLVSQTLPSAADANKYFYLPILGRYYSGQLYAVGAEAYYWSSSAYPLFSHLAYYLRFNNISVNVSYYRRYGGYRVGVFE